ncbi:unnamed protein product [Auanema sp. JU1783]|nr:unnamed protein product [Auanema sp. JU1783]
MAPLHERLRQYATKNKLYRNLIAEFFGTFMLLFIGTSIVAQYHLGREKTTQYIGVNLGWAFNIMLCVLATQRLSGGHLNPAVSILLWSMGHIPFTWFLLYSLAQLAGAFFGSACMYFYYYPLFDAFDGGVRAVLGSTGSAACFSSYPNAIIANSFTTAFVDQIIGTGLLCYFVCVVLDERNEIPKKFYSPIFAALVLMIGTGFGYFLGYPINPARDLGPRLFSAFIYGMDVFRVPTSTYFLAPIFGPLVGGLLGGWFYNLTIGIHNPDINEDQKDEPSNESKKLLQAEP